jgi:hypothetical protein
MGMNTHHGTNMNTIALNPTAMRITMIAILSMIFVFLTAGCERKIAHEKSVEVDGTEVTTKEKIVTEKPDGDVKVTEKEKTEDKSEGTVATESETKTYKK